MSATRTVCVRSCADSMAFLLATVWLNEPHMIVVTKPRMASASITSIRVKPDARADGCRRDITSLPRSSCSRLFSDGPWAPPPVEPPVPVVAPAPGFSARSSLAGSVRYWTTSSV